MAKRDFVQGLEVAQLPVFPTPVESTRAPTSADINYELGQVWVRKDTAQVYILAQLASGAASWTLASPGASDVDTLTGDSGGAISPAAGNITLAGGTNITTAGAGSTITFNLDAAISLATSVTSPIYTTSAADMNINSAANQDILVQMGDAAGAQKISFEDSASAEVASLDSDGAMTALSYATSAAAAGLTISGDDIDADGTDANITITVSPKGTGDFVVDVGDIQATAGDIIATRSSAAGEVTVEVTNSDNTSAASDSFFEAAVGGTSSGNPGMRFQISGGQNYSMGIDNASANDDLLICGDNDIGTDPLVTIAEAGNVTVNKGNLILGAVATQLQMNGGAATDFIGQATLASGTATVANTNIAANDRIFLTRAALNSSTALGELTITAQTASTEFIITAIDPADGTSTIAGDTSIVNYVIVREN